MTDDEILKVEEMLGRIKYLEEENKRLKSKIKQIDNYIEKMSYCPVVDNPKKDLIKILKKENKND